MATTISIYFSLKYLFLNFAASDEVFFDLFLSRETSSSTLTSLITELKVPDSHVNDSIAQQLTMMENRLLAHFNRCFAQLQQQIDDRFQQLEEKINKLETS